MSMLNIPIDLVECVVFRYLMLQDLGVLSAVCKEWRWLVLEKHARALCDGKVTRELLSESKMNPLEMLDMWERGQARMSCGEAHGAVISKEGSLQLWREGSRRLVISGLPKSVYAKNVSCGHNHTVIVASDNRAYTVGLNSHGQLGVGDQSSREQLTPVQFQDPVAQALAGKDFTLVLTQSNKLFWCGSLEVNGQPTNTEFSSESTVLTNIPFDHNLQPNEKIAKVCVGAEHILVLTNQNRLFSAGSATYSQLGRTVSPLESNRDLHEVVFDPKPSWPIVQIAAGVNHSLVLLGDGSVYSFGKSSCGELGLPKFVNAAVPRLIPNLPRAIAISAGNQHSLILAAQPNKIVAFGMGAFGQLGYRASFWSSSYPRDSSLPKEGERIKYISAGHGFSVCLSSDGCDLYACGKSSLCAGAGSFGETSSDVLPKFSRVPTLADW